MSCDGKFNVPLIVKIRKNQFIKDVVKWNNYQHRIWDW